MKQSAGIVVGDKSKKNKMVSDTRGRTHGKSKSNRIKKRQFLKTTMQMHSTATGIKGTEDMSDESDVQSGKWKDEYTSGIETSF